MLGKIFTYSGPERPELQGKTCITLNEGQNDEGKKFYHVCFPIYFDEHNCMPTFTTYEDSLSFFSEPRQYDFTSLFQVGDTVKVHSLPYYFEGGWSQRSFPKQYKVPIGSTYEVVKVDPKRGYCFYFEGEPIYFPEFCLVRDICYDFTNDVEDNYVIINGKWLSEGEYFKSDLTFKVYDDMSLLRETDTGKVATRSELLSRGYRYCLDTKLYSIDFWTSSFSGKHYSKDKKMYTSEDGHIGTSRQFKNEGYVFVKTLGKYDKKENLIYVQDLDDYVSASNKDSYKKIGESFYSMERVKKSSQVQGYHYSPEAIDLSKEFGSRYKIGFEVEKSSFRGSDYSGTELDFFTLFKGFETDSSCGVEAITNILPLDDSEGRSQVFDWIDEAEWVLKEPVSSSCSCHTNISVEGISSSDLMFKMKPYMSIVYAMFRYRLRNTHCKQNIRLDTTCTDKYSTINVKSSCIEVRIPNAIKNAGQLKRRYDLFYQVVDCAVNAVERDEFLSRILPIIDTIYTDSSEVLNFEKLFYEFLTKGEVAEEIKTFI